MEKDLIGTIIEFTNIKYTRTGNSVLNLNIFVNNEIMHCVAYEQLADQMEFTINEDDIIQFNGYQEYNKYNGIRSFRICYFTRLVASPISPTPALTNSYVEELIIDGNERFERIPHIMNAFENNHIEYAHKTLLAGDYYHYGSSYIIERKQNLDELVINLCTPKKALSLSREFRLGIKHELHWILLIESNRSCTLSEFDNWEICNKYIPKNNPYMVHPEMLKNVLLTFERKYHMTIYFCRREDMASAIYFFLSGEKLVA